MDIKPAKQKQDVKPTDSSTALLRYQLTVCKRENRKNIMIAILATAILAFAAGFVVSDFSRGEANALSNANSQLRIENAQLKALTTPVENQ